MQLLLPMHLPDLWYGWHRLCFLCSQRSVCTQIQVDEARCNDRGPRTGMDEALIYSYTAHYTGRVRRAGEEKDFEQCYFLPPSDFVQPL